MARRAKTPSSLQTYRAKRRFDETPEPKGRKGDRTGWSYLIQKHDASRLHYDFRLELDGVLKSWAVARGPSLDPRMKRLAIRTEDHPLDYGSFEGIIPEGNYGAGTVMLWDRGTWEPVGDPHRGLEEGKLVFRLHGERLKGLWALVRFKSKEKSRQETWLLIKESDEEADARRDVLTKYSDSVASHRDMPSIAANETAVWHSEKKPGRGRSRANRAAPGQRPKLPKFVEPALATLVDDVPAGKEWLFEIKFDGYRTLTSASGPEVRCYTRGGLDWTHRFQPIADAVGKLELEGALLDGEIVVVDDDGRSDFSALQQALGDGDRRARLSYFVFDLLMEGDKDLRPLPLLERKERLQRLLKAADRHGPIFYADHVRSDGRAMLETLCRKHFEGIIAKRWDRPYRGGRGHDWLKIKCGYEQEFVIVGYTRSEKDRPFSSLLLAVNEKSGLRYVGRVGTGFASRELESLAHRFKPLERASPARGLEVPRAAARRTRWLEPQLVAEIAFNGFTSDGIVRQGRYQGLREDKKAPQVRRERAQPLGEVAR